MKTWEDIKVGDMLYYVPSALSCCMYGYKAVEKTIVYAITHNKCGNVHVWVEFGGRKHDILIKKKELTETCPMCDNDDYSYFTTLKNAVLHVSGEILKQEYALKRAKEQITILMLENDI